MNRNAVFFFVILAILTALPAAASPGDDHKITICHVPPGNPGNAHEIEVDKSAWENGHSPHNAHSLDYAGGCEKEESTDVPTIPANTSTPRPTNTPNPSHTPRPTGTSIRLTPTPTRVAPTDEPRATSTVLVGSPVPAVGTSFPTCVAEATATSACCQLPVFSAQAEADDNQPITYGILYVLAGFIGGVTLAALMAVALIAASLRKR